jgi:hypothetical protein
MFCKDFENVNQRCVSGQQYTPDDAPQQFRRRVNIDIAYSAVPIATLSIGQTFFLEAYKGTHPGQFFCFELDSITTHGFICPWVSKTGRFLVNSQEDTLCFSVIDGLTKVYVERAKEPPGLRDSWDSTVSGCSLSSDHIQDSDEAINELKGKIERQDDKLEEIAQQMRFLIEFAETKLMNAFPPTP